MEILLFAVMVTHLMICPYTKVEESFNVQAIHDVLYHGVNISQYDHLEFPGVVPRTFIGPITIAVTSSPFIYLLDCMQFSKLASQIIVRMTLGIFVQIGLCTFGNAVGEKLGTGVKKWLFIIMISQFHFMFYMTRPLPNIFALVLVLLALGGWLRGQHIRFLWCSGAAILIFRAELTLYLGQILLIELFSKRLSLKKLLTYGVAAAVTLIGLTLCIDSYFWQRMIWPEAEVFWYNTVLNKSSQWGTLPFLWYFYSAIPRCLLLSLFLVPLGLILTPQTRIMIYPALLFVLLFSILPHKELRFIIYVVPVLNVAAACAMSRLWNNRNKSALQMLLATGAVLHLLGNLIGTGVFLTVSHYNYPGGEAIMLIQKSQLSTSNVNLHIDVKNAQTGISRFTQILPHWKYSKEEDLPANGEKMKSFTHLLIGNQTVLPYYKQSHKIIHTVEAFHKIQPQRNLKHPIQIKLHPEIWILEKNKT
ncbi:probable Dol-P-Man:Man(7)GlcNAc(2)-PP-Dol alpha-1,6-mannosyltransferase isoform X1 [Mytilus californianus]|uniref:probable Dol-P-Man:Man(7)GlcNAc(2)-PP-Dol alpha-1,6-mannosyltransferase isoform X1 n=1 Tax=Mytilus californianus TaxID=6549 RepID=UPI00224738BE|nr:probable Dol-P-Man:Man(7)GlcNAc(2)-PP-Dol alpha-1,6-mannosyltransferase isoform X1 [Mytilus californianus]XP_052090663.1 probable Dol-P-Man:Man(7)GlcNAc(2)-PP-Dol alpha-1,6-mannosyltransferase isoform X1 [Mytilus californianus]